MGRRQQNACDELHVREVSRRLVKASDSTIEPHVLAVSNLDLIPQRIQGSVFCIYPKPFDTDFNAVVHAFECGLPSLLNYFFPLAGRLVTNPSSGLPEVDFRNQGAELVVGEAAAVSLASLDYGAMGPSMRRILVPFGEDVPLSVQVVSFACGGFTVAWCMHHVLMDGSAMSQLVSAWSELARSGNNKLSVGSRPSHDRSSVFRPREPPSYDSASLDESFTLLDARRQVNVLALEQCLVERLYYIDASAMARLREAASGRRRRRATRAQAFSAYLWKVLAGVVGAADTHCRMGWWVNGRKVVTDPQLRAAVRDYFGNMVTFVVREERVQDVLAMPLPDVAAQVREAISAPAYDEHFQELVDWVEEHKPRRYIETAVLGLGSPEVSITMFSSFRMDTDFGFGHAALALPVVIKEVARSCSGYVQTCARPGHDDGSWFVNALVWPKLAAALEDDQLRIFKPVTPEYLGLFAPQNQRSRL
ncbi:hypothetical protein PR202_ga28032 [Eleusine coracana subsp. coracana]|uniref:Uncharacterized protein n=1 Tax=Eleusine coracana subsp. coracana TaxID=191504 RepID=A0AAV5DIG6_ELECO|nr:hypothetical protein QOZ80_7AG0559520 [Eleusine coracana subsp. coracana]GJN09975.1 hypothetical protein PR202_ga28032 [Eleusine coracana subsp. coracana]